MRRLGNFGPERSRHRGASICSGLNGNNESEEEFFFLVSFFLFVCFFFSSNPLSFSSSVSFQCVFFRCRWKSSHKRGLDDDNAETRPIPAPRRGGSLSRTLRLWRLTYAGRMNVWEHYDDGVRWPAKGLRCSGRPCVPLGRSASSSFGLSNYPG